MKRPFVYLAVILSLGIAASSRVAMPLAVVFFLCAASILAAMALNNRRRLSHIFLYLSVFFLGAAAFSSSNIIPPDHPSRYVPDGARAVFRGMVADEPVTVITPYKGLRTTFFLDVDSVLAKAGWAPSRGRVRAVLYSKIAAPGVTYGDVLLIEGKFTAASGRAMLIAGGRDRIKVLDRGCGNMFCRAAYSMRRSAAMAISSGFTQPARGFLEAVAIGRREDLKYYVSEDFVKTGTVHILSVSGSHVALIACIFMFLFRLIAVPKRAAMALTALVVIFYGFMAGLNPPVVRSVMMFFIFAAGYLFGRDADLLNSLGLAGFLMLIASPKSLFDPAFQLSFGSIVSIAAIFPAIERSFGLSARGRLSPAVKAGRFLAASIGVSLAAWAGTAPIVAYYFNICSPVAVLANLVVVPLVSVIMAAALLALSIPAVIGYLPAILAVPVELLSEALFKANHLFAALPFSNFRVPAPPWYFMMAYYAILVLMVAPKPVKLGKIELRTKHAVMAALIAANLFAWVVFLRPGPDGVRATFLDVGDGDAAIVEFPERGVMLVDGGSGGDPEAFDAGRNIVAPALWNRWAGRIDLLVVSHSHADHLGGALFVLENFDVGAVADSGYLFSMSNELSRRYLGIIKKKGIKRYVVRAGDRIAGVPGVDISVLAPRDGAKPGDPNESSVVLRVGLGKTGILFTGDVSGDEMRRLLELGRALRSEVLKVPHHGGSVGGAGLAKALVEAVGPKISIISSAKPARPEDGVMHVLKNNNFVYYETKNNGDVTIFLDGKSISSKIQPKQ